MGNIQALLRPPAPPPPPPPPPANVCPAPTVCPAPATNPSPNNLFNNLLKVPESTIIKHRKAPNPGNARANSNRGGRCATQTTRPGRSGTYGSSGSSSVNPYTPTPFLKTLLQKEKESVETLLKLASKVGPVVNTMVEHENAYDAAFELETPAAIPTYGSTLQGFTLLLFYVSYAALMIVITIYVNATTANAAAAAGTFVGFIVLGFISMGLIQRYG